ncbi:stabilizer of axonemal microtubules 4 [Heliangelus exortis]|uniref:stabilizer of axonemal microtubules 4 n=1 Tax=Heliangelus exortis TaxID=472823 RepID=UPI003A8EFEC8
MDFYATTYSLAHGQPGFCPHLGHHKGAGFVINNSSALSSLLCPRSVGPNITALLSSPCSHHPATSSTTTEHFQPLWFPNGQNPLPHSTPQPGSGYLQEFPPCWLHTGVGGPWPTWQFQETPKSSREHSTKSQPGPHPVLPDVLQKTTIGPKEPSGFTKAIPRTTRVLPALPGQPLGVSVTTRDYQPSLFSHGIELLPVLPVSSERASGFTRALPTSLGMVQDLGTPWLQAPPVTRASLIPSVSRKEPSGFTLNNGRYVSPRVSLSPPEPPHHRWAPTWLLELWGGTQPLRPSGFSTNNNPTTLGDVEGDPR